MFKIEKNIPIPKQIKGKIAMYPWREMKEGDSFFVPDIGNSKAASILGMAYAKLPPTLRPSRRPEGSGYRFWAVPKQ